MSTSPYDLQRFVDAQAPVYDAACAELAAGRKRSHWMWFIFPHLAVLGRSDTARFYGLQNAAHARAYGAHPILGPRLRDCFDSVLAIQGRTVHEIFGSPDDLKLCSCATLFCTAIPEEPRFAALIARCYGNTPDSLTLAHLQENHRPTAP